MEPQKAFTSLEEAFGALSEAAQAHSRRVEQYADLLFMELCASEEYLGNVRSRVRLKQELREEIRTAARYHDVGKVLVPDFYQWDSPRYSAEEQALYRKHCLAGEELARQILENQKGVTPTTVEILAEIMGCHHERWDGKGFPRQTAGEDTPVLGRIVAVASDLDHILMETRSETPVQTALEKLLDDSASRYDPVLIGLLIDAQRSLEKIFARYQGQSQAIPQASRIIRRKVRRPMWLEYRPISFLRDRSTAAVEARMQFRRGKEAVDYSQVTHLVKENKIELGMSFLLEACDMFRRLRACQVGGQFVALPCVDGLLRKRGAATLITKLFTDTDSDPAGICLILPKEDGAAPTPTMLENCKKLRTLGCKLMLSGVDMDQVEDTTLEKLSITHLRLTPQDAQELNRLSPRLRGLARKGVTLLADGLDNHRLQQSLVEAGVSIGTGSLMGEYAPEDVFISGELAQAGL